jgi:hypothetical protein
MLMIGVKGVQGDQAADELASVLVAGDALEIERSMPVALPDVQRRAVDPGTIAAVSLILSIPGALLAAVNLADRLQKRKKAEEVIETAGRLRLERRVETTIITLEGPKALDQLDPDQLLEIAVQVSKND